MSNKRRLVGWLALSSLAVLAASGDFARDAIRSLWPSSRSNWDSLRYEPGASGADAWSLVATPTAESLGRFYVDQDGPVRFAMESADAESPEFAWPE